MDLFNGLWQYGYIGAYQGSYSAFSPKDIELKSIRDAPVCGLITYVDLAFCPEN